MSHARDLGIAARLAEFSRRLAATACSDAAGTAMSLEAALATAATALAATMDGNGSIYLAGNGGSAAIVGHAHADLVNAAGLRAFVLHDSPLLTCMANDRGYPAAFAEILRRLRPGAADVLIAVGSSGRSPNLLAACDVARAGGARVLGFSGFDADNPLRRRGDINFWVDAADYGLVECAHQFLLHNLTDRLAARATPDQP